MSAKNICFLFVLTQQIEFVQFRNHLIQFGGVRVNQDAAVLGPLCISVKAQI